MFTSAIKFPIRYTLLLLVLCTTSTFAETYYIGGYIGETKIQDDHFFNQVENKPDTDYTSTSYSLFTGVALAQNLLLEIEVGSSEPFTSESSLNFSYEELRIENIYYRVNLIQTFPLPGDYRWYIKESLGIISVNQSYTNATGQMKKKERTDAVFPGIALGVQQAFYYRRHKFDAYIEFQYNGYSLKNDYNSYHIRQHTLGAGVKWKF